MNVFSTRILPQKGIEVFEKAGIMVNCWRKERSPTKQELYDGSKNADGLLVLGRTEIDREFLEANRHLKVISLFSVGYDHVDIKTADELGIPVGHTPDVLSKATADTAFLLMQMTARKALFHHKRIQKGDWAVFDPEAGLGLDLKDKTIGIFGLGNIGYEMARSCRGAFDMKVIYHNRSRNEKAEHAFQAELVSFDELLQKSDVISVHANLSSETKNKFNREAFSKMKPSAIFINTARGGIHNEIDLTEALRSGTIWGAGLDVTNPEPMQPGNPLLEMETVSVLPHIGSATRETRDAMAILTAQNAIAGLKGEPLPARVTFSRTN
ncbi:2-hydroxyacid dehydrogenase [Flavobacterium silvaticum]|uniref:D-glycerate dehydrogenase n=1 Tax=Flavobacterium silvaticum TaxID=1852020 RepID=A0A972JGJ4_9FLAO|nr:D-glycerate dehydrogenase [Flavobacterium silvaticum]NMH28256.1 D-glycerate dehydrogenase [Flavobacterium silvaticum]